VIAGVLAGVVVAALVGDGKDVEHSTMVGPSGQEYEPDGKGAWARHAEGGCAADVTGAARVGGELVVAGRSAPLYRKKKGLWFAIELGDEGRTVFSHGPSAGVAVDKAVFVPDKKGWKRVGNVPGKVAQLWVDGTDVWASTDSTLYHLRGGSFGKVKGKAATALVGGTPWAVTAAGLVDLDGKRTVAATLDGAAVTVVGAGGAPGDDQLTVVVETGAGLTLARTAKAAKALEKVDALPSTGTVAGVAVDSGGDVLVAFADGSFALRRAGTWTTGQVTDDLPAVHQGSAPARTR
jgi:hypothetical protein